MNCTNGIHGKSHFFNSTVSTETTGATDQAASGKTQSNRKVDIVVHSNQYNGPQCYISDLRGYGDIATGVRIIDHIKNSEFKDRSIAFVSHYYGDLDEKKKITAMMAIKDVHPLLLSRAEPSEEKEKEYDQLMRHADCIIHGPSLSSSDVEESRRDYGGYKQLYLREYDHFKRIDGKKDLSRYDNHAILTKRYSKPRRHKFFTPPSERGSFFATGIEVDLLHLIDRSQHNNGFDNSAIAEVLSSVEINDSPVNNNPVYFIYSGNAPEHNILAALYYAFKFHIKDNQKVVIFSSVKLDDIKCALEQFSVSVNFVYKIKYTNLKEDSVDLMSNSSKKKRTIAKIIGHKKKYILLVNPFPLSNNDFNKLLQTASIVFASGDISCSDTLSLGKVPIMDRYKKQPLFNALEAKLAESEQCSERFIETWKQLSIAFSTIDPPESSKKKMPKLSLTDKQFHPDHQQFTEYLKEKNKMPYVINSHLERTLR